jgi:DNA-binding response OmpR family regulator
MRGLGYGAADYVVKPFNPIELAARVSRLID